MNPYSVPSVEEIRNLYPIEEGKVTIIFMSEYYTNSGEFITALVPFIQAGYTYIENEAGIDNGYVLFSERIGVHDNTLAHLMTKPPSTYVTFQDMSDNIRTGIVYYAELMD